MERASSSCHSFLSCCCSNGHLSEFSISCFDTAWPKNKLVLKTSIALHQFPFLRPRVSAMAITNIFNKPFFRCRITVKSFFWKTLCISTPCEMYFLSFLELNFLPFQQKSLSIDGNNYLELGDLSAKLLLS